MVSSSTPVVPPVGSPGASKPVSETVDTNNVAIVTEEVENKPKTFEEYKNKFLDGIPAYKDYMKTKVALTTLTGGIFGLYSGYIIGDLSAGLVNGGKYTIATAIASLGFYTCTYSMKQTR